MRWLIVALTFVFGCIVAAHASPSLRYDGLYCRASDEGDGFTFYYRFYGDGVFLSTVSSGRPQQVATWLHRGQESPIGRDAYGRYVIRHHQIHFITRPREEPIKYFAEISQNHLILRPYTQFKRHRISMRLDFVAVHFTR